ncbi:hypothetical protein GC207_12410 [bacterium]|nr:hypothetical protein [bacterium]
MQIACEHIGLAASDPIALRDWYVKTFDARQLRELSSKPPAFMIQLPGGLCVEIYQAGFALRMTCDNQLRGWRHLALRVENLDAAREELRKRGVEFTEDVRPAGGGGRVIFFTDPEGNLFHLVERTEGFRLA